MTGVDCTKRSKIVELCTDLARFMKTIHAVHVGLVGRPRRLEVGFSHSYAKLD